MTGCVAKSKKIMGTKKWRK